MTAVAMTANSPMKKGRPAALRATWPTLLNTQEKTHMFTRKRSKASWRRRIDDLEARVAELHVRLDELHVRLDVHTAARLAQDPVPARLRLLPGGAR